MLPLKNEQHHLIDILPEFAYFRQEKSLEGNFECQFSDLVKDMKLYEYMKK